jgi:hypothetical protein
VVEFLAHFAGWINGILQYEVGGIRLSWLVLISFIGLAIKIVVGAATQK